MYLERGRSRGMVGEEGAEKSGRRRIAGGAKKVITSKDGAAGFHLNLNINLKHKLNSKLCSSTKTLLSLSLWGLSCGHIVTFQ